MLDLNGPNCELCPGGGTVVRRYKWYGAVISKAYMIHTVTHAPPYHLYRRTTWVRRLTSSMPSRPRARLSRSRSPLSAPTPRPRRQDFADAGASYITFHPEASPHIDRTLQLIRSTGCKSGLVFNPATPLDCLEYVMDKVDIILLMSVNPGFGGQSFIPGTLDKARKARKMIDDSGFDIRLQIDGGVSAANIKEIAEAGVDMFVAGSAIFRDPRTEEAYKKTIDAMRDELAAAKVPANKVAA